MASGILSVLVALTHSESTFTNRTGCGVSACCVAEGIGYSAEDPGYNLFSVLTWLVAPDPLAAAAAALWFAVCALLPLMRYFTVVHGAMTTSSWSQPPMLAPFRLSTPRTWSETFWIRIDLPTGEFPSNSSRTKVCPITQTLAALATSRSVNISPSSRSLQSRTSRYSGVVPQIFMGTQLRPP